MYTFDVITTRLPAHTPNTNPTIELFSIDCRKTKTKVIPTANQKKEKYPREPMRTQSKTDPNALSAGKRGRPSLDWFWFCILLVEREGASFMDQSPHEVKQKQSNPELVSTLNGKLPNYENNRSKSAKFIYLSTQSIFGCFSNLKVKGSSVKSLQLRETLGLFMVKRKIVKYR